MATPGGEPAEGKHGYEFEADWALDEHDPEWWADRFEVVEEFPGAEPATA